MGVSHTGSARAAGWLAGWKCIFQRRLDRVFQEVHLFASLLIIPVYVLARVLDSSRFICTLPGIYRKSGLILPHSPFLYLSPVTNFFPVFRRES